MTDATWDSKHFISNIFSIDRNILLRFSFDTNHHQAKNVLSILLQAVWVFIITRHILFTYFTKSNHEHLRT